MAVEPVIGEEPPPAKAPRTRRPRVHPGDEATATAETPEAPPAPARAPRTRTPRVPVEAAAPAVSGGNVADILRAVEQQGRQIEQLARSQDDGARRGASTPAAPATAIPRVGVFVDSANIELACDRLRARFDWGKILAMLTKDRQLVRAISYAPVHEDIGVSLETQRFAEPFLGRGYKVVTKPLKRFQDGSVKANVDVEMAIDIVEMLDRLDIVCLVSGDGDFQYLVEAVQRKGVRVEVVAVGASTATNLKNAADLYIDLAQRLAQIRA